MSDNDSKLMEGTVAVTYPPEAVAQAEKKFSFSFNHSGGECRVFLRGGRVAVEAPNDAGAAFVELADGVRRLEQQSRNLDSTEVMKFISKFAKMMASYHSELSKHAVYELIEAATMDLDSMSLRDRCLAELVIEQGVKAERAGAKEFTLTKEMLDKRVKEKMKRNQDAD